MATKVPYSVPYLNGDGFNCPHCHAFSHQFWKRPQIEAGGNFYPVKDLSLAICERCKGESFWVGNRMFYPEHEGVEPVNPDLGPEIQEDYMEAASILNRSPRGAAALMRLCVQKLCVQLGEKGDKIDDDIASLVKKGLSPTIQKALDSLRVIGNNAVHPGQIDLTDDPETAGKLFTFLNLIAQTMISDPKEIEATYASLPPTALDGIKKRDGRAPKV